MCVEPAGIWADRKLHEDVNEPGLNVRILSWFDLFIVYIAVFIGLYTGFFDGCLY